MNVYDEEILLFLNIFWGIAVFYYSLQAEKLTFI